MPLVLLVEDDPDQLALRRMLLEAAGYQVIEARSAVEANAQMDASSPNAVVMDLRIPLREDGFSLLRRLSPRVPVIVLTGSNLRDVDGLPLFRALQKPCPTPALLEAIQAAVEHHGHLG